MVSPSSLENIYAKYKETAASSRQDLIYGEDKCGYDVTQTEAAIHLLLI